MTWIRLECGVQEAGTDWSVGLVASDMTVMSVNLSYWSKELCRKSQKWSQCSLSFAIEWGKQSLSHAPLS